MSTTASSPAALRSSSLSSSPSSLTATHSLVSRSPSIAQPARYHFPRLHTSTPLFLTSGSAMAKSYRTPMVPVTPRTYTHTTTTCTHARTQTTHCCPIDATHAPSDDDDVSSSTRRRTRTRTHASLPRQQQQSLQFVTASSQAACAPTAAQTAYPRRLSTYDSEPLRRCCGIGHTWCHHRCRCRCRGR
jgi:hypothetical protein